ncbi:unnamed protein product [Lepeophtheirus salmonis]|uniref:(salmon louse) hypothetical protein n=1 Tax=Lepeophtheirus salmonis TaxID=72036 RepID=A0A7R8CBM4_LEPSM|nr:unnamed protein product [Lepeophtheirus salmonis]CAF2754548.1 unnamed protein product [Lepeophtheirus salmonis]
MGGTDDKQSLSPFPQSFTVRPSDLPVDAQLEIIDVKSDVELKNKFASVGFNTCYKYLLPGYPILTTLTAKMLSKKRPVALNERQRSSSVPNVLEEDSNPYYPPFDIVPQSPQFPIPKRDSTGFTITKKLGNFPHELSLNIRHNHPTLGLSDLQLQSNPIPSFISPKMNRRQGVLSLGLPDHMNLFKKSRPNTPASTISRSRDAYDEFLLSSSGLSSGSHSPNNQYSTPIDSSPPPLAPKGLSIGPPPPVIRFANRNFLNQGRDDD